MHDSDYNSMLDSKWTYCDYHPEMGAAVEREQVGRRRDELITQTCDLIRNGAIIVAHHKCIIAATKLIV